jgi:hypothetical protein
MLAISSVFVVIYLRIVMREEGAAVSTVVRDQRRRRAPSPPALRKPRGKRPLMHGFLIAMSLLWLFPCSTRS